MESPADFDDLVQRIHKLPSELFNKVYEETFTAAETSCYLDKDYKPPSPLQVDRATRSFFARSYYGNTTFAIFNFEQLEAWLMSLSREHDSFLQDLRVVYAWGRGRYGGLTTPTAEAAARWLYAHAVTGLKSEELADLEAAMLLAFNKLVCSSRRLRGIPDSGTTPCLITVVKVPENLMEDVVAGGLCEIEDCESCNMLRAVYWGDD